MTTRGKKKPDIRSRKGAFAEINRDIFQNYYRARRAINSRTAQKRAKTIFPFREKRAETTRHIRSGIFRLTFRDWPHRRSLCRVIDVS